MFQLFIGNYERVMGGLVYHKLGEDFIPCKVTGYTYKSRTYSLLSEDKRSFKTKQIYIKA